MDTKKKVIICCECEEFVKINDTIHLLGSDKRYCRPCMKKTQTEKHGICLIYEYMPHGLLKGCKCCDSDQYVNTIIKSHHYNNEHMEYSGICDTCIESKFTLSGCGEFCHISKIQQ